MAVFFLRRFYFWKKIPQYGQEFQNPERVLDGCKHRGICGIIKATQNKRTFRHATADKGIFLYAKNKILRAIKNFSKIMENFWRQSGNKTRRLGNLCGNIKTAGRENPSARRKEKNKKIEPIQPAMRGKKDKKANRTAAWKKRGRAKSGTIRRKSAPQKFSHARKNQKLKPSPKFPQIKSSGSRFRLL